MANIQMEIKAMGSKNSEAFKILLETPGLIEDTIIQYGCWEPAIDYIIAHHMKKDGIFIDVGANIGYHSLSTALLLPKAECIAFEPHPQIFEQLKANIELNQFKNIVPHNMAVGDFCGSTTINLTNDTSYNRGLSTILSDSSLENESHKVDVKIMTLDEFLDQEEKKRVNVMKIDTQGYEYQVLKGALDTIKRSKPVILMEIHRISGMEVKEILNLLPDYLHFQLDVWRGHLQPIERNDSNIYDDNFDIVCVPKKGVN